MSTIGPVTPMIMLLTSVRVVLRVAHVLASAMVYLTLLLQANRDGNGCNVSK